ncbi:MAG: hypothetical protein HYR70_04735 [Chloroflexi bacterium]|nr:hypothetical protein [Chloroflexota bacterium]MBI3340482.1 hypothetical protein [Chloroflexota bacterium]
MAPKTNARRFILSLGLILLVVATLLPHPVSARTLNEASLPDLNAFALAVQNGEANTLRGVYAENIFALPVLQQPTYNAAFVSRDPNSVTQFSLASQFGNVGLLAHNDLSGQYFFQLYQGERIQLVYGDGRIEYFRVTGIYRYQAESPFSTKSNFTDLDTREYLTAYDLFAKVYKGPRHITFQTCIANNGNSSWGRLFVIAEPEKSLPQLAAQIQ